MRTTEENIIYTRGELLDLLDETLQRGYVEGFWGGSYRVGFGTMFDFCIKNKFCTREQLTIRSTEESKNEFAWRIKELFQHFLDKKYEEDKNKKP